MGPVGQGWLDYLQGPFSSAGTGDMDYNLWEKERFRGTSQRASHRIPKWRVRCRLEASSCTAGALSPALTGEAAVWPFPDTHTASTVVGLCFLLCLERWCTALVQLRKALGDIRLLGVEGWACRARAASPSASLRGPQPNLTKPPTISNALGTKCVAGFGAEKVTGATAE